LLHRFTLPDGEDVYVGGWWSPSRRGSVENLPRAAALQCPTLAMGPETNPWWYHFTTYSYAVMGGREGIDGQVTYRADDYPVPDQMTHPSTTVQLHDLGGSGYEGGTNAWTYYVNLFTLDPHDGRSNYLMCDGHVDLLAFEALNETMWQSRWVPSGPAGGAN